MAILPQPPQQPTPRPAAPLTRPLPTVTPTPTPTAHVRPARPARFWRIPMTPRRLSVWVERLSGLRAYHEEMRQAAQRAWQTHLAEVARLGYGNPGALPTPADCAETLARITPPDALSRGVCESAEAWDTAVAAMLAGYGLQVYVREEWHCGYQGAHYAVTSATQRGLQAAGYRFGVTEPPRASVPAFLTDQLGQTGRTSADTATDTAESGERGVDPADTQPVKLLDIRRFFTAGWRTHRTHRRAGGSRGRTGSIGQDSAGSED